MNIQYPFKYPFGAKKKSHAGQEPHVQENPKYPFDEYPFDFTNILYPLKGYFDFNEYPSYKKPA